MSTNNLKKLIQSKEWYYQGAEARPLYINIPLRSSVDSEDPGKKDKYSLIILHFSNDFCDIYYDKFGMKRITDGILLQQEKDNKTIDNLYGSCIKVMDNFIGNEMKFMSVDPKKLSDKALVSKLNEVCTAAKHVWDHVLFIDAFDIISDKIISSSFDSYNNSHNFAGSKITNKEIEILTLPDELAFTQRERLSLLKIAAAAKEGKNIEKAIAEHQQQFFWYKSNYSVIEILDESYFMQKLDAVLKNESAEQIKKDIMSFESYEKRIKQQKEDISKKHNLNSSLKETIYFFTRLTLLRDHRKEWVLKSHVLIKHLAAEISKRAKIPLHELEYLSYWEIESIAQLKKMKNLNERIKDSAWVADESYGYAGHFGKEAVQINGFLQKRIVTEINALQGVAASSGYAKGNVKIINRVQEFSKMQKGDILVSSNTRPEYVPIMKLAAAIITDEGGITCHAAIVSRELKIPCIVGTQAATKVLKDGMVVEVDAEKGVVKIVKE